MKKQKNEIFIVHLLFLFTDTWHIMPIKELLMKMADKTQAGMLKKSGYNDIWKLVRAVAYLLRRFRQNLDFDKIWTKSNRVRPGQY